MRHAGLASLLVLGCSTSGAAPAPPASSAPGASAQPATSVTAPARAATPARRRASELSESVRAFPSELGGGVIAAEALLAVGGEGFVTVWGRTALDGKQRKALAEGRVEPGALASLPGKLLAAPSGWVQAAREKDEDGPERAFGVVLVAEQATRLRLSVGAVGQLRLFVRGREVLAHESTADRTALTDERFVDVELPAGASTLLALARATSPRGASFAVRLRTPAEETPEVWAAPLVRVKGGDPLTAAPLGALLDLDVAHEPIAGGFRLRAGARLRGLAPEGAGRLTLQDGARVLASAAPSIAALLEGARLEADLVLAPKEGEPGGPHRPVCVGVSVGAEGASGPERTGRRSCWRGTLHERAVRLRATLDEARPAALEPARLSLLWDLSEILAALGDEKLDVSWAEERVKHVEALGAELAAGADPFARVTGVVRRAFRSPLDGQLSGYVLYVPPSSKRPPKKGAEGGAPLVVVAHGLDHKPELALRGLIGEAPDKDLDLGFAARHLPPFPDLRAFLVAPTAYGNAGPRPLGEADTLAVVDDVLRHHPIDRRRVSMTGYSLGGTMAFTIPLHHPDRFAAAAPLCGYPNLLTYESVAKVPHKPWEEVLLGSRFIGHYAENGLHLPMYPVHGGKDGPARTQVMVDRYRSLGYRVDFDLQEDLEHDIWTYAYDDGRMIVRLRGHAIPERPRRVRLVTGDYRWDRSHWVRVHALSPGLFAPFSGTAAEFKRERFAEIDARWDPEAGRIEVTVKNAAELDLDVPSLAPAAPPKLVVNGADLGAVPLDRHAFVAVDGPKLLTAPSSRAGKKRHGVAGPLDDLGFHPLVFVYGARSPAHVEANRLVAEHLARGDAYAARYPVVADTEVGWEAIRGKSVVLVGSPESNLVTASIAPMLRVRFSPGALELRGERFQGPLTGVAFVAPSPFEPERYVAVYAGLTPRATLLARALPRLSPDFVVWDERLAGDRGELLLARRDVARAGFWDEDWR